MEYSRDDFSRDFVTRTLTIVKEYEGEYDASILLNCLLGLLIVPKEKWFDRIPLDPIEKLSDWGINPKSIHSFGIDRQGNPFKPTLRQLVKSLRNSVAHFRIEPLANEGKCSGFSFSDQSGFEATVSLHELNSLVHRLASHLVDPPQEGDRQDQTRSGRHNVSHSTNRLRIGTWNLDRSGVRGRDRQRPQIEKLLQLDADVWILTETHAALALPGYTSLASALDTTFHKAGESCAAIWSRYPLKKIETADPTSNSCAELESPFGPMLIYGTIITYHADGVWEGLAKPWERHRQAVLEQTAEWRELRQRYPEHLFCVAGDFNMNLDGRRWYGVKDAKENLLKGLEIAGLYCATCDDLQAPPYSLSRSTVNHICLSKDLQATKPVEVWEGTVNGVQLSDHNGILVDIQRAG